MGCNALQYCSELQEERRNPPIDDVCIASVLATGLPPGIAFEEIYACHKTLYSLIFGCNESDMLSLSSDILEEEIVCFHPRNRLVSLAQTVSACSEVAIYRPVMKDFRHSS